MFRWAKAHAALRAKALAGELPAALRSPPRRGGAEVGIELPSADQWHAEGFPAADEARARHANRGHIPMYVIFDIADLDRAFPAGDVQPQTDVLPEQGRRSAGRPSAMHVVEAEMIRRASATPCELMEKLGDECDALAKWVRPICAAMQPPVHPPGRATIARKLGSVYRDLTKERTKQRPN